MAWKINWEDSARRSLLKLDKRIQREIIAYLDERIASGNDPRAFGKALVGNLTGLWRYRVRDHRIICRIENEKLTILVLQVAHRRSVYDS